MQLWRIGLLRQRVRSSISVEIKGIRGSPLAKRCKNEATFLMFDKGERRWRRRKEIRAIVLGDGWSSGQTHG
jgi:hypothetical protein